MKAAAGREKKQERTGMNRRKESEESGESTTTRATNKTRKKGTRQATTRKGKENYSLRERMFKIKKLMDKTDYTQR